MNMWYVKTVFKKNIMEKTFSLKPLEIRWTQILKHTLNNKQINKIKKTHKLLYLFISIIEITFNYWLSSTSTISSQDTIILFQVTFDFLTQVILYLHP